MHLPSRDLRNAMTSSFSTISLSASSAPSCCPSAVLAGVSFLGGIAVRLVPGTQLRSRKVVSCNRTAAGCEYLPITLFSSAMQCQAVAVCSCKHLCCNRCKESKAARQSESLFDHHLWAAGRWGKLLRTNQLTKGSLTGHAIACYDTPNLAARVQEC